MKNIIKKIVKIVLAGTADSIWLHVRLSLY